MSGSGPALVLAAALLQAGPPRPASWAEVQRQAHSPGPYHDITLTASEANAYFAALDRQPGAGPLPAGVSDVVLDAEPGELSGSARVDFDKISKSANPMLGMFSGQHTLAVRARVDSAQAPRAHLTVTAVRLDGVVVPDWLLDMAVRVWLKPKYPNLGREFSVPLPRHASSVSVAPGAVTLHYPRSIDGAGPSAAAPRAPLKRR